MLKLLQILSIILLASAATFRVDPDSGFFVDDVGRVRVFHGVNVVHKIPPFLPSASGFDPATSLSTVDMQNLTAWGFNVVRLGIFWSALEPSPGVFNDTYLSSVMKLVNDLGSHGIYTILDFHQDVFSRKFCGNGFPDWAAITSNDSLPFALPVAIIPSDNTTGVPPLSVCQAVPFVGYYLSESVNEAFGNFYNNTLGVRDKFVNFWSRVSAGFRNNSNILGYEIMNEPWPGDIYRHPEVFGTGDATNLMPLYSDVSSQIRKNDPGRIILFQKALTDILSDSTFTKFNSSNNVLSYHAQCIAAEVLPPTVADIIERMRFRDPTGNVQHLSVCDLFVSLSILSATRDAHRLGVGIFLTEFGASENLSTIARVASIADSLMQSWTFWQFKSFHDITTTDPHEGLYNSTGALDVAKFRILSRTYAQAISGIPLFSSFNETSGVFAMRLLINRDITSPTTIYLNEALYYPRGFRVIFDPPTAATFTSPSKNTVHVTYNPTAVSGTPLTISIIPTR
jgi:endoglycosylceramidase